MNKHGASERIKGCTVKNFIALTPDERELVRKWRNHRSIRRWMYNDRLISTVEHAAFIRRLKDSSADFYWLVKRDERGYAGVIALKRIDRRNRNAYLGIYADPDSSGNGRLLMDCLQRLAFKNFRLHTLRLEVLSSNRHALDFYRRQGFKREGTLGEFVFKSGRWHDVIVMGKREYERV
jgi:UDP-4-amino-4,6-dideoxy-N-acetyl-beta-L-altrosamine N-acetyltransferase